MHIFHTELYIHIWNTISDGEAEIRLLRHNCHINSNVCQIFSGFKGQINWKKLIGQINWSNKLEDFLPEANKSQSANSNDY